MQLSFDKGAVIVAGGTGGIGAAICRRFAEAGHPIIATYHRSEDKARALTAEIAAAGGSCECIRVDLAQAGEVEGLFAAARERHPRVAHIVYAAGPHFEFNFIGEIPDDDWHRVVDADVNGAFHLIQGAVRTFREQGGGNLVAVITSAVQRVPVRDIMSAAPKAAIEMLIRGVARESGRFGIRANCVGPGWINAGLGKQALDEKLDEQARQKILRQVIPLQRFGEADDIAWATLFLCSQQAGFITGQSLAVDGGAQI
ncbi:MAG: SDR family NAD(P)-dependent oxidoreductase [Gammaproteobacteria bacterium]